MTNADMILDQVDVVKLDISIWTSSKKLRAEDLMLADGSRLPPEDLASLGTKKTIHPDKLKEFNRIKKEAERICLESGTRFIGGFANPRTEITRITQELDALSKKFYQERDLFLASYTADTEEWIRCHAEFGDAIRRAIEPVGTVAAKLRFDYVVFRVTKPEQEESLERRALTMSEQLFREISQDANQIIDRSFVGKDSVTVRALNGFRRIRDKLDSLGFLDHRCMPIVDEIDSVLDLLPKSGPYNGVVFHSLFRLGLLLSDPEKIKRHGSGLLQPDTVINFDIELEDDLDDQLISDADSTLADEDIVQQPVLEITTDTEDNDLGEQPEVQIESDVDDLPGFDAFLAKYDSSKEDTVTQEPLEAAKPFVPSDALLGLVESVLGSLVDDVQVTAKAVTQFANVTPVESSSEDDLEDIDDDDLVESEETAESTDFWF
ncbi:MAG: DUF3150 domain-containing protein [Methylobacter sp.]|nr:DUF3150 domain-containing protein [Methylobacter sp.]